VVIGGDGVGDLRHRATLRVPRRSCILRQGGHRCRSATCWRGCADAVRGNELDFGRRQAFACAATSSDVFSPRTNAEHSSSNIALKMILVGITRGVSTR